MNYKKMNSGQALVETALIMFILTAMVFATIQLAIIAYGAIVANYAGFCAARSAVVSRKTGIVTNAGIAGGYVLATQSSGGNNIKPIPIISISKNYMPLNFAKMDYTSDEIKVVNLKLTYAQKIMFSSFFNRFGISTGGLFSNTVECNMVKSPDELYYRKAYPGAREW